MAESVTLTIQATCEQLAGDLALTFSHRRRADAQIDDLQRLIDDRATILAAHDQGSDVPRVVLERHGWLAVREAQLNARDAPDWWRTGRASAMEDAAQRGADWLRSLGVTDSDVFGDR